MFLGLRELRFARMRFALMGAVVALTWYHWPAVTAKRTTSTSPAYSSVPLWVPGETSGAPAAVLGKSSAPRSLT